MKPDLSLEKSTSSVLNLEKCYPNDGGNCLKTSLSPHLALGGNGRGLPRDIDLIHSPGLPRPKVLPLGMQSLGIWAARQADTHMALSPLFSSPLRVSGEEAVPGSLGHAAIPEGTWP